jgi:putative flavoprotein involved in K+ transport
MRTTDTLIIGAGQAGLAASRYLTEHGHDHVVLDRGRIAQRWRSDTWDSLRLLTPNWLNALPGQPYDGPDPDGFSSAAALTEQLTDYARSFDAPVEEYTEVDLLHKTDQRFDVVTDRSVWRATNVIIATGWCEEPAIPASAAMLAADVHQVPPRDYRNPGSLPPGGVLVVGASATGVQIADELRSAGRDVTIAVGRHTRMPRSYRGMDIYWWLERLGVLDKTIDEMPDRELARTEPSAQLVGRPDRRRLDLATLQADGVHLVGRVTAVDDHRVRLAADVPMTVGAAERRMRRLLGEIDGHIEANGLGHEVLAAEPSRPVAPTPVVGDLDLRAAGIRTVVWATGHRRSYPWLRLPVLDQHGEIRQHRGRTSIPGLYVLGQRFQHRRNSNFIGGVGRDAAFVADHIVGPHRGVDADTSALSGH